MKKAQIEIVGLTVIVVILAVGLVIALTFILRPKIDTLEDQRQNIRATALLNTLIETNTDIQANTNKQRLKEVIKECYPDAVACENALKEPILNKIFKNQDYFLIIKQEPDDPLMIKSHNDLQNCLGNKIVTDPVVIVASPKMTVTLIICSPEFQTSIV